MSATEGMRLTAFPVTTIVGLDLKRSSTALLISAGVTLSIISRYFSLRTFPKILNYIKGGKEI